MWFFKKRRCLAVDFIEARSTRHPLDNKKGLSDDDARVERAGRTYGLDYDLRLSTGSKSMPPLTGVLATASQNEKKYSPNMLERTGLILKRW